MECKNCGDTDLALFTYFETEADSGLYEASFDCRQCNHQFTVIVDETELNQYR